MVGDLDDHVGKLSPKVGANCKHAQGRRVLEARPRELEGLADEIDRGRACGLLDSGYGAAHGAVLLDGPNRTEALRRQIRHVVRGGGQTYLGAVSA